ARCGEVVWSTLREAAPRLRGFPPCSLLPRWRKAYGIAPLTAQRVACDSAFSEGVGVQLP
ncbi:MAG: hypothetical protein QNJ47_02185, partial [Nostocaceae cyanobacterium]|nr:hypothetical protein [Nostocaceae cyanobacterium]